MTFLPLENITIHEHHDNSRIRPLINRLRSSKILRNPPIVTPYQPGSNHYIVLDGANRTMALRAMGFPHVLAQVVEPDDPGLDLQSWNHVIWEMNSRRFLDNLNSIPGLDLEPVPLGSVQANLYETCNLLLVRLGDGTTYSACTCVDDLTERVEFMNQIVNSYQDSARLDRTNSQDVHTLSQIYPLFCGLVIFPQIRIADILRLAAVGCLLPSGITRVTISPRALHIDYPLSELESDDPIEAKINRLDRWLKDLLARKGVRYYAEATYLFDE
ncbi:MAG TPA: hypothetical protein VN363_05020 [Anaerolineales bacterium]|nr:hypothetical protein [Anaerolineales bacterium]